MNSEIFCRIEQLYSGLGIDVSKGSAGRAEAAALAAGFELAEALLDAVFSNVFVQTSNRDGLRMFLSLINEKQQENEEAERQLVIDRLSNGWGYLGYADFVNALQALFPSAEFRINANEIILNHIANPVTAESLINAGRFIKEYTPAFSMVHFSGDGADFESFDGFDMQWFQLDEVNLPFRLLDELEC